MNIMNIIFGNNKKSGIHFNSTSTTNNMIQLDLFKDYLIPRYSNNGIMLNSSKGFLIHELLEYCNKNYFNLGEDINEKYVFCNFQTSNDIAVICHFDFINNNLKILIRSNNQNIHQFKKEFDIIINNILSNINIH